MDWKTSNSINNGSMIDPHHIKHLKAFFQSNIFNDFLHRLGKEGERFKSLNIIIDCTSRINLFIDNGDYLAAFQRLRGLSLATLQYIMHEDGDREDVENVAMLSGLDYWEGVIIYCNAVGILDGENSAEFIKLVNHDPYINTGGGFSMPKIKSSNPKENMKELIKSTNLTIEDNIGRVFDELKRH